MCGRQAKQARRGLVEQANARIRIDTEIGDRGEFVQVGKALPILDFGLRCNQRIVLHFQFDLVHLQLMHQLQQIGLHIRSRFAPVNQALLGTATQLIGRRRSTFLFSH